MRPTAVEIVGRRVESRTSPRSVTRSTTSHLPARSRLVWSDESGEREVGTRCTHATIPAIVMIASGRRRIKLRRVGASRSFTRIFYLFLGCRVIPLSGSATASIKSVDPHRPCVARRNFFFRRRKVSKCSLA